jgi:hypothetical protein
MSFSVRLTEEQRSLITRAAALRGWKPAQLLRVAAYEKAAHILNTSEETNVDFRGVAQRVAELIAKERQGTDGRGELLVVDDLSDPPLPDPEDRPVVQVTPPLLTLDEIAELRAAARFGGAEFLSLIVEACDAIAKKVGRHLPPPVDPETL